MNDNFFEIASRILLPAGLFFLGIIFNWMREDIKGIRRDINGIRKDIGEVVRKVFDHVSDHSAHCKHPGGCQK